MALSGQMIRPTVFDFVNTFLVMPIGRVGNDQVGRVTMHRYLVASFC